MAAASFKPIPEATLRRLPAYYHLLRELQNAGTQFVSCSLIGKQLNLDPTQVRKDLESTGMAGKPKVGYPLGDLVRWIEDFLGWNNAKDAFLVGAGSLGSALLGYGKFRQFGLNIVAAFDSDAEKVGGQIHGKQVLPLEKLPDLARRMHIHIGIVTVPAEAAQKVADLMVEGGILAIWNFAPVYLRVPEHVILQSEDLYHSLASLSF
jgi:redox-sensing transcriptional repressor